MDVDHDIPKYDDGLRGPYREEITVETKIKSTNKGFAMLAKLGWSEGQPLGISGDGRLLFSSGASRIMTSDKTRPCRSYPIPDQTRPDRIGKDKPRLPDD